MNGKLVTRLEYEAYNSMALKEMKKICDQIRTKWPDIRNIAIFHRIGEVQVEQSSIIIAISSPHRKDSLEACDFCINEFKRTVPIWKKVIYLFEYQVFTFFENIFEKKRSGMQIRRIRGKKIASVFIMRRKLSSSFLFCQKKLIY